MGNREKLLMCIKEIEDESAFFKELADDLKKIDRELMRGAAYDNFSDDYIELYCSLATLTGFKYQMYEKLSNIGIHLSWGEDYEKR